MFKDCSTVRRRSLTTRSILGICLFLSAPVLAQEVPEDPSAEPTEEAPVEPSEDADSELQDLNLELFSDPVLESVEEGEEAGVEETPQVLEEEGIAGPETKDQETVEALVSALQEVRDLRYRRHKILGISLLPGGVLVGLSTSHGGLLVLTMAAGVGVIRAADEFKGLRELDQEIEWLRTVNLGALQLGEFYLSEAARSGKIRRSIIGGSLVAGSMLFYAVSVNEALGPAIYNLGGLMVIGSAVLTLRTSREERISQAYEQRKAEIWGSSTPRPDSP